jgi:hypothetical protein
MLTINHKFRGNNILINMELLFLHFFVNKKINNNFVVAFLF